MDPTERLMMDRLARGNKIHQTARVDPRVTLGKNNYIGPFCYIMGDARIGDNNRFEAYCAVGTPAEYRGKESQGTVLIGNQNKINEFVTIHSAMGPEDATVIGNNTYIMTKAHIGHDAIIEDEVTLSSSSIVGGHSVVMRHANLGLAAVVHQKRVVGQHAMIGMNSTVTKSIPPYVIGWGSPCKPYRVNVVGLRRTGMDPKMIEAIGHWLTKEQTQVEIKHELSYLVDEQVKRWLDRVKTVEI